MKEDASKETGVYKEFMKIYEKTSDFVAQKEKIQKAVEKFAPGTVLDDAALKTLIVDGKLTINGVEIEMKGNTFSRILNGPCANEGYMLEFGKLSIKYSKKERQPGDVYVGMTHAENYQSANSFRVGVGGAYGETPRPKPVQPKPDK